MSFKLPETERRAFDISIAESPPVASASSEADILHPGRGPLTCSSMSACAMTVQGIDGNREQQRTMPQTVTPAAALGSDHNPSVSKKRLIWTTDPGGGRILCVEG